MTNELNNMNSESGSVLIILLVIMLVLIAAGGFWVWQNFYARPFTPVELTNPEKKKLKFKLFALEQSAKKSGNQQKNTGETIVYGEGKLKPEQYSEKNASREIFLTERELNSFIKDPGVAKNVAVDLSDDQLSVKVLLPLDDEFPILGGKTIKLHMGTTLAYSNNNLLVVMNGISVGGVPVPSAWWGGIKNKNLVEYFGGNNGFWDTLSAGISDFRITDGKLYVKLKE